MLIQFFLKLYGVHTGLNALPFKDYWVYAYAVKLRGGFWECRTHLCLQSNTPRQRTEIRHGALSPRMSCLLYHIITSLQL